MTQRIVKTHRIARIVVDLLQYRLARPVGGSGVAQVDVILAEVTLDSGASGLGFSYVLQGGGEPALAAARALAQKRLLGQAFHHPEAAWHLLTAALNRTRRGPNYIGLAALDVALWDLHAKVLDVPLGVAMGGAPRNVKVYGSGDFAPSHAPEEAAAIARSHAARGLAGVKPRVGGRRADADVMRAVVEAVSIDVMVDANEKCTPASAHRLVASARELGVLFVEEPLPADDIAGLRALGAAFPGLIAGGEHLQGAAEMLPLIGERMVGVVQPDLAMVGGLTEVLRVARIAQAFGVETAPHFLPGLFVHCACAVPGITWLEEFPLLEPLFSGWPELSHDGTLAMREVAGHGLLLADGAREAFKVNI